MMMMMKLNNNDGSADDDAVNLHLNLVHSIKYVGIGKRLTALH